MAAANTRLAVRCFLRGSQIHLRGWVVHVCVCVCKCAVGGGDPSHKTTINTHIHTYVLDIREPIK